MRDRDHIMLDRFGDRITVSVRPGLGRVYVTIDEGESSAHVSITAGDCRELAHELLNAAEDVRES